MTKQPAGVLIANRGEIAVRIIRACRSLGLRAIAVYSDADAGAMHCSLADDAVRIGPAAATESYLNVEAVIDAAIAANAVMVHPGYGFLAESAELARAVDARGLRFVGPSAEVLELLGDKRAARTEASRIGLTTLPAVELASGVGAGEASAIRVPLLIKAAFGGGGRGMRIVRHLDQLTEAIDSARREALRAFGRPELFVEQLVEHGRHVEVQILADGQGNVVDLGVRDCTVQRRHQKVIEESPAPNLSSSQTERLRAEARLLAQSVGYVGACTVEFLLDSASGQAYFLEVNPRIQVEHTVSEAVTGTDIVASQLRIARGEPLGITQDQVHVRGHAIQARINAEDPESNFVPVSGVVTRWLPPGGPFIRVDSALEPGTEVTPFYDSMVAKVIAWGTTRDEAIGRLDQALAELRLTGVRHTGAYCRALITHDTFRNAQHWTTWLDDEPPPVPEGDQALAAEHHDGASPPPAQRVAQIRTAGGVLELVIPTSSANAANPRTLVATRPANKRSESENGPAAPMDATVVRFTVEPGDTVSRGQTVAVVESMKMESHVTALSDGIVVRLCASPGDSVKRGTLLVEIDDNL